jgi:DNA ligase D-like protein (predicted polymerase)/DNA ligase D-like protein (predicted 3'-phosphoesterase)
MMGLDKYWKKRDFSNTSEPEGKVLKQTKHRFVVQEHHASILHFDFRLEMAGVLKSWSVPKGPSLDPGLKRLAIEVEDHPVSYINFEGNISEGNYGAGDVRVWDSGTYTVKEQDAMKALESGKLTFTLKGKKLKGEFALVRMKGQERQWLLLKHRDEYAEQGWELKTILPTDKYKKTEKTRVKTKSKSTSSRTSRSDEVTHFKSLTTFFKTGNLSGNAEIKTREGTISLTNLDKVYFPDDEYTKGDLIKYYYEVSKFILPYVSNRPLIMKRYPNGITKPSFHQHDVDKVPDFVTTETIKVEEGHSVDYLVGGNLATLLYMANLGAIEQHPWHSRLKSLNNPDWFVFDLDPGEKVAFADICTVAVRLKEILEQLELDSLVKTSGSRGLHIYVPVKPIYSYKEIAEIAEQIATLVAVDLSDIATVDRSLKKRRATQIYVDHMQNSKGKSVAAPYSVRPKAGALVSMPLEWKEVKTRKVDPAKYTIKTALKRLESKGDLFQTLNGSRQELQMAMKLINRLKEEKLLKAVR